MIARDNEAPANRALQGEQADMQEPPYHRSRRIMNRVTRRGFLRVAGLGAAALAALSKARFVASRLRAGAGGAVGFGLGIP